MVSGGSNTEIVRVNAGQGDSYNLFTLDLPQISGIAFDTLGTLYIAKPTGQIYKIDLNTGDYTFVTQASSYINCIAFRPSTNELWAALFKVIGDGRDSIYTIDLSTDTTNPIGVTGFGIMTNDLAFDKDNKLYGVIGTSTSIGKLIEINTTNGFGTEVGEVGFHNIVGLSYSINGPVVSVDEEISIIPKIYSLEQNYPNPFNPSTKIKYKIAEIGFVTLKVYDVLGNEVITLVNGQKPVGNYEVVFDASLLTSGVYFYQLKAGSYVATKKMVLLR